MLGEARKGIGEVKISQITFAAFPSISDYFKIRSLKTSWGRTTRMETLGSVGSALSVAKLLGRSLSAWVTLDQKVLS